MQIIHFENKNLLFKAYKCYIRCNNKYVVNKILYLVIE